MRFVSCGSILTVIVLISTSCYAEKDSNSYLWGGNSNENKFNMYWKDASNVLEDLYQFQYLFIRLHGCVWSEYGLGPSYDDDGENRDGDAYWYQYRTQQFRANAAYSLYGILKGKSDSVLGSSCTKGTYINSFFTLEGADTIVSALSLNVKSNGTNNPGVNCYQIQQENNNNNKNNENNNQHRRVKDGSRDNNNANTISTTMGCSMDAEFVVATFAGKTCDGVYFLNTTDDLPDYNAAIDAVTCRKVWDLSKQLKQSSESSSSSLAEIILNSSSACDSTIYPNCPDPFGVKKRYTSSLLAATGSTTSRSKSRPSLQGPLRFLSWVGLLLGIALASMAYLIRSRHKIKSKGGGARGVMLCMVSDIEQTVARQIPPPKKKRKKIDTAGVLDDTSTLGPPGLARALQEDEEAENSRKKVFRSWDIGKGVKTSRSKSKTPSSLSRGLKSRSDVPKRSASGKKRASKSPARKYVPPLDKYVAPPDLSKSASSEEKAAVDLDSVTYIPPSLSRAKSENGKPGELT